MTFSFSFCVLLCFLSLSSSLYSHFYVRLFYNGSYLNKKLVKVFDTYSMSSFLFWQSNFIYNQPTFFFILCLFFPFFEEKNIWHLIRQFNTWNLMITKSTNIINSYIRQLHKHKLKFFDIVFFLKEETW